MTTSQVNPIELHELVMLSKQLYYVITDFYDATDIIRDRVLFVDKKTIDDVVSKGSVDITKKLADDFILPAKEYEWFLQPSGRGASTWVLTEALAVTDCPNFPENINVGRVFTFPDLKKYGIPISESVMVDPDEIVALSIAGQLYHAKKGYVMEELGRVISSRAEFETELFRDALDELFGGSASKARVKRDASIEQHLRGKARIHGYSLKLERIKPKFQTQLHEFGVGIKSTRSMELSLGYLADWELKLETDEADGNTKADPYCSLKFHALKTGAQNISCVVQTPCRYTFDAYEVNVMVNGELVEVVERFLSYKDAKMHVREKYGLTLPKISTVRKHIARQTGVYIPHPLKK